MIFILLLVLDFTQIVELLHVPLQSLYTYKTRLELAQKQRKLIGGEDKNCNCACLPATKPTENGHKKGI